MLRKLEARQRITSFCAYNFRRLKAVRVVQARRQAILRIQAAWRGYTTRFLHRSELLKSYEQQQRFVRVWGKAIRMLQLTQPKSWASIRAFFDMTAADRYDADDDVSRTMHELHMVPNVEDDASADPVVDEISGD